MQSYFIEIALPALMVSLLLYGLPFVVYALLSSRVKTNGRLIFLGIFVLLVWIQPFIIKTTYSLMYFILTTWGYLLVIALLTHYIARLIPQRRINRVVLLSFFFLLYLIIPGIVFQSDFSQLFLDRGFEITFASYSYCVESEKNKKCPKLSEGLFFLLVNPTLVYPLRGNEIGLPALRWTGLGRITIGILFFLLQPLVGVVFSDIGYSYDPSFGINSIYSYLHISLFVLGYLVVLYIGHSGLASFQIGLMLQLGYRIPERYHYPFLATSPIDLWRRWNTYLGLWLQRYVFFPLAIRWGKRTNSSNLGKVFAIITTFGLCGFFHEVAGYSLRFYWPYGAVIAFLFAGFGFIFWAIAGRLKKSVLRRLRLESYIFVYRLVFLFSIFAMANFMIVFGWIALPALSGLPLPFFFTSLLTRFYVLF